ncbi:MAG: trimethylamine methyltransferase family protein, partial [Desulfotignum sp.]
MYDRMQELSRQDMEKIHDAAMDLLKTTGVAFNDKEALEIFKNNGFKVAGTTVFFEESAVQKAVETAPERFTVHARNPEKNV